MSAPISRAIIAVSFLTSASVNPWPTSSRSSLRMPHRSTLTFLSDMEIPSSLLYDNLISETRRPPNGRDDPRGFRNQSFREVFAFLPPGLPVFDTTSPGKGGKLKQRLSASREFHPSEVLSELPPLIESVAGQEYHCVLTRSLRNSLSLFYGRMGTARRLIWPSLMGNPPQAGLGASSKVALRFLGASSGNVFQFPDIQLSRCSYLLLIGRSKKPFGYKGIVTQVCSNVR